jgi:peptidoglycan/LPS O-acetylase OafA/YrhL
MQSTRPEGFNFRSRNRELDILRGVAILAVIINHAGMETIPGFPELEGAAGFVFWSLKGLGWSGVDLFFILSGFLIGGSLINEIEKTGAVDLRLFWFKRAFKILPSYGALLLILAITGAVSFAWNQVPVFLFFLQNYLAPQVVGPTWSLAVEEHFYLLLPLSLTGLLLLRGGDSRRALRGLPVLALAVILLVVAGRVLHARSGVVPDDFMQSHFRFDTLFLGVLLHWVWRYRSDLARRLATPWVLPLIAVLIAPATVLSRNDPLMFTAGFSALALAYALLTLFALERGFGRFGAGPAGAAVAAVGRWSYNIYLWHLFILAVGVPGYEGLQSLLATVGLHPTLQAAVQILVLALFSTLVGWLFTTVVEEPFLRLRNRLLRRRALAQGQGPRVAPAPAGRLQPEVVTRIRTVSTSQPMP